MAPRRTPLTFVTIAAAAIGLSACGTGLSARELASTPAWFKAKQKDIARQDYPDLAAIPDPSVATQSDSRWRAVEQDLLTQGKAANGLAVSGAVLGVLLLGAGVPLLVVGLKRKKTGQQALQPLLAPGFVGVGLRGRF